MADLRCSASSPAPLPPQFNQEMIPEIKEIDASCLHAPGGDRLFSTVAAANEIAAQILSVSGLIRLKHSEGNGNNSLKSTAAGALKVAPFAAKAVRLEPAATTRRWPFFQNIRETVRALKG